MSHENELPIIRTLNAVAESTGSMDVVPADIADRVAAVIKANREPQQSRPEQPITELINFLSSGPSVSEEAMFLAEHPLESQIRDLYERKDPVPEGLIGRLIDEIQPRGSGDADNG